MRAGDTVRFGYGQSHTRVINQESTCLVIGVYSRADSVPKERSISINHRGRLMDERIYGGLAQLLHIPG